MSPDSIPARFRRAASTRRTVIVAWLRVVLPLAALVILSTLFLLSRRPDPEAAIPYASVDAEARARDPQITAPTYAGVTSDGATIALSADSATPTADGEVGGARGLDLEWRSPDGFTVDLTAPEAAMGAQTITLDGGVHIATSTGWTLTAPRIEAATDRSHIAGSGGIEAAAPFGRITADRLTVRQTGIGGAAPAATLVFDGRVRLTYQP